MNIQNEIQLSYIKSDQSSDQTNAIAFEKPILKRKILKRKDNSMLTRNYSLDQQTFDALAFKKERYQIFQRNQGGLTSELRLLLPF